jgi:hypothetical protein
MLASGTAYIIAHESEKSGLYRLWYGIRHRQRCYSRPPQFQTIYISGGKKKQIKNRYCVVLFPKGKLEKGDLGLIEVKDFIFCRGEVQ